MLDKIKEFFLELQEKLDLTKRFPEYFDKRIFMGSLLLMLALLAITFMTNGQTLTFAYAECESKTPCRNIYYVCAPDTPPEMDCTPYEMFPPLYKHMAIEYGNRTQLEPGEIIGNKPNILARNFNGIILLIVGLAVTFNHIAYTYLRGKTDVDKK